MSVESLIEEAEEPLSEAAPLFEPDEPAPLAHPPRIFNPWVVALVVTIGTFMEVLDTSIANVALPHIAGSLSASQDESTWVLTSYLVANAIVLPISGWISSVIGRKRYYIGCVLLFTLFSAVCGLAPTLGILVVFRVLQGLAGGGLQPSVQAILADTFSIEKRGMAMAVYTVAILCAPVLGPTLGGWITDNYSWRWIFYINIPVGVACILATRAVLRDPPYMVKQRAERKGKPLSVDVVGLSLVSLGLASVEVVLDRGQELDWFGSHFITTLTIVGIAALLFAVFWELRHKSPVVNLRLLGERNFLFCCLIVLGLYTVLYATTFLLPQFMQEMMGYDATTAGLAMSPSGIATIIEVPFVGWMLSRGLDARRMIVVGLVTIMVGSWWMSHMDLQIAEIDLIWPRTLQVLGVGFTTVPLSTIMFRFLPREQSGNAAGIYALVRNEGGSIGIALSSTMLQRTAQLHQTMLVSHLTPADLPAVQAAAAAGQSLGGNVANAHYAGMALVYQQLLQQSSLLAYMDQFRMLSGIILFLIPMVFFLKKAPAVKGKIELDAH